MNLLVLLIGDNHNFLYGLIDYFTKENKFFKCNKVLLVYTARTESIFNNIKNFFKVDIEGIDLGNEVRNIEKTEKLILEKLEELSPQKVHLNYTGGTKSMGIGAFLAVDKYECEDKIFSDMDFSKKIYLKRGEIFPEKGTFENLVHFKIKDLLTLEGLKLSSFKNENSEFFNEEFVKFLFDKLDNEEKEFFENLWDKNFKELKKLEWKKSLEDVFDTNISNKKLEKLQKFIKGTFLEEYLFYILKKYQNELGLDDILWNVEILNKEKALFELDVLVSKGYTIYGFSVTTDKDKKLIKQKTFEVDKRVEEIIGIGGKFIIVGYGDEKEMEKVRKEIGDKRNRGGYDVIGRDELLDEKKLTEKLRGIFK